MFKYPCFVCACVLCCLCMCCFVYVAFVVVVMCGFVCVDLLVTALFLLLFLFRCVCLVSV